MSTMTTGQMIGEVIANGILHAEQLRLRLVKRRLSAPMGADIEKTSADIALLRGLARSRGDSELGQALDGAVAELEAIAGRDEDRRADEALSPVPMSAEKLRIIERCFAGEYLDITREHRAARGRWHDARIVVEPVGTRNPESDPAYAQVVRLLEEGGCGALMESDDRRLGNMATGCGRRDRVALANVDVLCALFRAVLAGSIRPRAFSLRRSALAVPDLSGAGDASPKAVCMTPMKAMEMAYACDPDISRQSSPESFARMAVELMIGTGGMRAMVRDRATGRAEKSLVRHARGCVMKLAAERRSAPRGANTVSRVASLRRQPRGQAHA